ncbi:MAG: glycosyltransferase family 4 protein [Actinomycetota bacterium]
MLTVACDTGPLHGPATGIARATAGLLDALAHHDIAVVPYVVSYRAHVNVGTRRLALPASLALRAWATFDRPRADRFVQDDDHGVDLVHGTNYVVPPSTLPRIVSVYDCWALDHPDLVHSDVRLAMRVLRRSIATGAVVHASSHATAERLRAHFPNADVEMIHLGSTPLPSPPVAPSTRLGELVGSRPFVLAMGTIEVRKNLPRLVRAFATANIADASLVIAGRDGNDRPALDAALAELDPAIRSHVVVTGRVDDSDASWLVHNAHVLVYPSLDEGFGFPILEAFAAGVPVVASTAGSIPEVAGDAAVLTDPNDTDRLAAAIVRAVDDDTERARLISAGRRRVDAFTWASTATRMVALYRRVVADAVRS